VLCWQVDLATQADITRVQERLHYINSFAEILQSTRSTVSLDRILDLHSFSMERVEEVSEWEPELAKPAEASSACNDPACHEGHGHGHEGRGHGQGHKHQGTTTPGCMGQHVPTHKGHEVTPLCGKTKPKKRLKKKHDLSGVSSVGLILKGDLNQARFDQFMGDLLQTRAQDIYRSKGVLSIQGHDEKYVFQGVHDQITFCPSKTGWDPELPRAERVNKLVFIGKGLDQQELRDQFMACLVHKPK